MVKAARNAKRRLMPESLITKVIDMARKEGRVRKLGPPEEPAGTRTVQPAALPKQEAKPTATVTDLSQEDFILQAKSKGYGSWKEILETLDVKSTREVREIGYRKALEHLPDRTKAEAEQERRRLNRGLLYQLKKRQRGSQSLTSRAELLLSIAGRTDAYALQQPDGSYIAIREPLTPKEAEQHARGR